MESHIGKKQEIFNVLLKMIKKMLQIHHQSKCTLLNKLDEGEKVAKKEITQMDTCIFAAFLHISLFPLYTYTFS